MYDLIGDIHGHTTELVLLLEQLGYDRRRGYYAHAERRAIFLGDFIDRGPRILDVLRLVRPMIESGSALAVMGNHEFNALAYHTPDPTRPGRFLREHGPRQVARHRATLQQLRPDELWPFLEWFRTLPLWLDLEGFRVVHACWDPLSVERIRVSLSEHGGFTLPFLQAASQAGSELFVAVRTVLKGKEIELPEGGIWIDGEGNEHRSTRVRWYSSPANVTFRSYAWRPQAAFPDEAIPPSLAKSLYPYPEDEKPVFFGHYCLQGGRPALLAPNVACLDYCVTESGLLCAYRWQGEQQLTEDHFACVRTR